MTVFGLIMERIIKTAITGGIGSGKSYVSSLLKDRGIEVYDCDSAAKRIMRETLSVRKALTNLIGQDAYVDGKPNKAVISKFLLAAEENKKRINAIVHPAVADDFKASGLHFMECAILFESGFDKLVDCVACVSAPIEVRVDRIIVRDSITREKAREWINCQMSQEEIEAKSDFVILNDGNKPLEPQIDEMLAALQLR